MWQIASCDKGTPGVRGGLGGGRQLVHRSKVYACYKSPNNINDEFHQEMTMADVGSPNSGRIPDLSCLEWHVCRESSKRSSSVTHTCPRDQSINSGGKLRVASLGLKDVDEQFQESIRTQKSSLRHKLQTKGLKLGQRVGDVELRFDADSQTPSPYERHKLETTPRA